MKIVSYRFDASDGPVRCFYAYTKRWKLLIAWATENWYSEDKARMIPLWITRKGDLFAWRLAVRIGKR